MSRLMICSILFVVMVLSVACGTAPGQQPETVSTAPAPTPTQSAIQPTPTLMSEPGGEVPVEVEVVVSATVASPYEATPEVDHITCDSDIYIQPGIGAFCSLEELVNAILSVKGTYESLYAENGSLSGGTYGYDCSTSSVRAWAVSVILDLLLLESDPYQVIVYEGSCTAKVVTSGEYSAVYWGDKVYTHTTTDLKGTELSHVLCRSDKAVYPSAWAGNFSYEGKQYRYVSPDGDFDSTSGHYEARDGSMLSFDEAQALREKTETVYHEIIDAKVCETFGWTVVANVYYVAE